MIEVIKVIDFTDVFVSNEGDPLHQGKRLLPEDWNFSRSLRLQSPCHRLRKRQPPGMCPDHSTKNDAVIQTDQRRVQTDIDPSEVVRGGSVFLSSEFQCPFQYDGKIKAE